MDREYFESYCGRGSYDEEYLFHSGVLHCIDLADHWGLRISSVLVLGAATGRVLEHFAGAWGIQPEGCEISAWAHRHIPARFRSRIARADLRSYLPRLERRGAQFDLVFCNALVYLKEADVSDVLARCARISRWFHFWSSTSEDFEPGDRHRVILRPRSWWRTSFVGAGWAPTRSPYLWRSTLRAGGAAGAGSRSASG